MSAWALCHLLSLIFFVFFLFCYLCCVTFIHSDFSISATSSWECPHCGAFLNAHYHNTVADLILPQHGSYGITARILSCFFPRPPANCSKLWLCLAVPLTLLCVVSHCDCYSPGIDLCVLLQWNASLKWKGSSHITGQSSEPIKRMLALFLFMTWNLCSCTVSEWSHCVCRQQWRLWMSWICLGLKEDLGQLSTRYQMISSTVR